VWDEVELRRLYAWMAVSSSEVNTRRNRMTNTNGTNRNGRATRLSTETKAAFKTTEFIVYVIILVGMFIAAAVTDNGDDGQGFGADQVWLYATILTPEASRSPAAASTTTPTRTTTAADPGSRALR
jgi:hypothetical protein